MASEEEKQAAYDAGVAAINGLHGPEGCPFAAGTEERASWLQGYASRVETLPTKEDLLAAIAAEEAQG